MAQLFFAIAAPLFFSRILFLAQIDENLGLMVQVRLSFILLRFARNYLWHSHPHLSGAWKCSARLSDVRYNISAITWREKGRELLRAVAEISTIRVEDEKETRLEKRRRAWFCLRLHW